MFEPDPCLVIHSTTLSKHLLSSWSFQAPGIQAGTGQLFPLETVAWWALAGQLSRTSPGWGDEGCDAGACGSHGVGGDT